MNIDNRTVAMMLLLQAAIQSMVLYLNFKWSRSNKSFGWWALGSAVLTFGFIFNVIHDMPSIASFSIVMYNILFVLGQLIIYIGIRIFFDKKGIHRWMIAVGAIYPILIIYFTIIQDSLVIRQILMTLTIASISFAIAGELSVSKSSKVYKSAYALAMVFYIETVFFFLRAFATLLNVLGDTFDSTPMQTATYLITFVIHLLWTLGLIIMAMQRSMAESIEDKETLETIFKTGTTAILITRLEDGRIYRANDGFHELSGFMPQELIDKTIVDVNIWNDQEERVKFVAELTATGMCDNREIDLRVKDGRLIVGVISAKIIMLNGIPHIYSSTIDITALKQAETALRANEERYRMVADFTYDWEYWIDPDGCFIYSSPSCERITGYTSEKFLMDSGFLKSIIHPDDQELYKSHSQKYNSTTEKPHDELLFRIITQSGEIRFIEHICQSVYNLDGEWLGRRASNRDITDRKHLESKLDAEMRLKNVAIMQLEASEKELILLSEELKVKNITLSELSITDKLTGIFNRNYFDKVLADEIDRAERYKFPVSLIMLDFDHFKKVNDTYGHDVGDKVLIKFSKIISQLVRKPDVLARWGGEEFVILMPQTDLKGALISAEKLRHSVEDIDHPNAGVVTVSIGVAERLIGETLESFFKRTDEALFRSKKEGRNRVSSDVCMNPRSLVQMEICWKKEWETQNVEIDTQHMDLLDIANEFLSMSLDDMSHSIISAKLDTFLEHLSTHFTTEEKILLEVGFPDAAQHALIHEDLMNKAVELVSLCKRNELKPSAGFIFIAEEIIMGHLLKEDVKFIDYVRKE